MALVSLQEISLAFALTPAFESGDSNTARGDFDIVSELAREYLSGRTRRSPRRNIYHRSLLDRKSQWR